MKINLKYKPDNMSNEEYKKAIVNYLHKSTLSIFMPIMKIEDFDEEYVSKKNKKRLNKGKKK